MISGAFKILKSIWTGEQEQRRTGEMENEKTAISFFVSSRLCGKIKRIMNLITHTKNLCSLDLSFSQFH